MFWLVFPAFVPLYAPFTHFVCIFVHLCPSAIDAVQVFSSGGWSPAIPSCPARKSHASSEEELLLQQLEAHSFVQRFRILAPHFPLEGTLLGPAAGPS